MINVAPGKMTADEKAHYFKHQHLIIGRVIKHKFFPKGIKDKPRFSNFLSFRDNNI